MSCITAMAAHLPSRPTISDAARAASPARRDVWRLAWQLLIGNELLASAALGLAGLLLLAAWLPQMPAGDLEAYARWLAGVQNRFGAVSPLLRTLGLFSITETALFRVLIALIGSALASRGVEYLWEAWNGRTPPPPAEAIPITIEQPLVQLVAPLQRRFRVKEQGEYVVIDHFPLADAARLLAVLGGLMLIVGALLTCTGGWRSGNVLTSVGETVPIGKRTPYTLRLDSLRENSTGQVTLMQETEPMAAGALTPERAFSAAGLAVQLEAIETAVRVQATLSDVQPLELLTAATASPAQTVVVRFAADRPDAALAAPQAGLLIRLSYLPSFRVMLNRAPDGKTIFEGDVPADGLVRAGNITVALTPERYARLVITHDPGAWPALMGWLMMAAGMIGVTLWPHRRTWLRAIQDNRTELVGDALPVAEETRHD